MSSAEIAAARKRRFALIGDVGIEDKSQKSYNRKAPNIKTKQNVPESNDSLQQPPPFNMEPSAEDILKLVEEAPDIAQLDSGKLSELVQNLEKSVLKNEQMRAKYSDDPMRFMQSEEDLNENIRKMNEIAASPNLYSKFVEFRGPSILIGLLSHENTDITIETVNLINEMTDPTTIFEDEGTIIFVEALIKANLLDLLVQNLYRFSESEEDDRGFYNVLSIFENLIEIDPSYCLSICNTNGDVIKILLQKIKKNVRNETTFYCAEILATFVNCSPEIRKRICDKSSANLLNICVLVFNSFTKKYLKTAEEVEYSANIFDVLSACLLSFDSLVKQQFISSKCLSPILKMIIKKKLRCREGAIKVLNYFLCDSSQNCRFFIENQGLKALFYAFMAKSNKKNDKISNKDSADNDLLEEHALSIIVQLFANLSDTSYLRLLNKFNENNFEKIDRLVELHDKYLTRLQEYDKRTNIKEQNEGFESNTLENRLDNGLYMLQLTDLIIGFICTAGNVEIKERAIQVLHQYDTDLNDVKNTLKEYMINIDNKKNDINETKAQKFSITSTIINNVLSII